MYIKYKENEIHIALNFQGKKLRAIFKTEDDLKTFLELIEN